MTTLTVILSVLTGVSAALTIAAKYRRSTWMEYSFKPLTTCLIIAIALLAADPVSTQYKALIVLGLVASLAGDVFLMLPDRFLPGLVSFLVAHLLYIAAFVTADYGTAPLWFIIPFVFYGALMLRILWAHLGTMADYGTAPLWFIIPFVFYGALMLRILWAHLGTMRGPVIVYMAVILLMGWMAANRWIETDQFSALLALVGAYFFIASDSVLAIERFRGTWRTAQFWVLSTYFVAQWLIALSVHR